MQKPATPVEQCLWACQRISLRLDGEISELEQARLDAHLQSCPGCRALAAELEGLTGMLRTAPLAEPSTRFELPRRRNVGVYALRAVAGTATAAVMALSVFVGLSGLVGPKLSASPAAGVDLRMARERIAVKERLLDQLERSVGRHVAARIPAGLAAAEQVTLGAQRFSSNQVSSTSEGR